MERLLKEREARLRSTMAFAAIASTDTDVERTGSADFSKPEVARDQSDGSSSGGVDDSGRNLDEKYRDRSWRKNLNSPDGRGDGFGGLSGFSGGEGGVIPVSDQGNIFFASDIVDAEDHAVDSPRGDDVDLPRLLLKGGRASEPSRRRGGDRTPQRSLPSLSYDQGGKASQQTSTMNKSSPDGLLMDSVVAGGTHKESGEGAVGSGQVGDCRENDERELSEEGEEDDCLAAARRLEDLLSFRTRMDRRSSLRVMGGKSSTHAGGGGLSGGGGTHRIEVWANVHILKLFPRFLENALRWVFPMSPRRCPVPLKPRSGVTRLLSIALGLDAIVCHGFTAHLFGSAESIAISDAVEISQTNMTSTSPATILIDLAWSYPQLPSSSPISNHPTFPGTR